MVEDPRADNSRDHRSSAPHTKIATRCKQIPAKLGFRPACRRGRGLLQPPAQTLASVRGQRFEGQPHREVPYYVCQPPSAAGSLLFDGVTGRTLAVRLTPQTLVEAPVGSSIQRPTREVRGYRGTTWSTMTRHLSFGTFSGPLQLLRMISSGPLQLLRMISRGPLAPLSAI